MHQPSDGLLKAKSPSLLPLANLRLDFVQRCHASIHVIVDVAMEHPDARVIGNHVDSFHLRLHQRDNIGALAVVRYHVAVPVRSVNAELLAERDQIPANPLVFFHSHHLAGSVDVAVDRELGIGNGES